jgi:hypothetical protein
LRACEPDRYGPGTYSRLFTQGLVIVNPTDKEVVISVAANLIDVTANSAGTQFVIPAHDARLLVGPGAE